ncbi:unnamed protein product [Durusdinium trenchii]|uniref:Uncharacterized protein n=1 Tax=Durusdinium trenchii TaxID=1381693 RepID=A0ABP0I0B4_9DINO
MVATKSRVPTSPKPVMARPRKGMNKVVEMNDFCARMVVDDLIQNALKEDAVAAAEELQCESEDEGSVVEAYDDYDEDDVVSLSGEADSDEEEVETFNMVCQVAKRAVTQSLHQAKWISSSAPVVRPIAVGSQANPDLAGRRVASHPRALPGQLHQLQCSSGQANPDLAGRSVASHPRALPGELHQLQCSSGQANPDLAGRRMASHPRALPGRPGGAAGGDASQDLAIHCVGCHPPTFPGLG